MEAAEQLARETGRTVEIYDDEGSLLEQVEARS